MAGMKRAKARVGERSTTSGGGPWTLSGALDLSYQDFTFLSDGDTIEVTVREPAIAFWTGKATYNVAGSVRTISPTTVEESGGAFAGGTKEISADFLASRAMLREDIAGAIVTGGTATAYTVASRRVYDTLARLDGNIVAFSPHVINGQTVTLSVDGLTAKPLRKAPGVDLQSNVLIAGTPYSAVFNNSDGAFYLHAFGDAPGIPLGASVEYWAPTTPSTHFAFPTGQAISRTAFAALFALIGTTYGVGDGSTTFNIPDLSGRVPVMKEASASRLTSTYFGGNSTLLGATGGLESETLSLAQLPTGITTSGSNSINVAGPIGGHTVPFDATNIAFAAAAGGTLVWTGGGATNSLSFSGSNTITGTSNNTSGNAHSIVQPTIICNRIFRVL
jgi:microcystin-dependent protein